jgi:hypothetical protein
MQIQVLDHMPAMSATRISHDLTVSLAISSVISIVKGVVRAVVDRLP